MFNQTNYSDTNEREKVRILQTLNNEVQTMAIKLDTIVCKVEDNVFKIKTPQSPYIRELCPAEFNLKPLNEHQTTTIHQPLQQHVIKDDNKTILVSVIDHPIQIANLGNGQTAAILTTANTTNLENIGPKFQLDSNHQLVKIIDQFPPFGDQLENPSETKQRSKSRSSNKSKRAQKSPTQPTPTSIAGTAQIETKKAEPTNKRNKQQRQFNTFVRESINQLLGPDFMRTHDVQDIDAQVMEMIRKEAVENYLPDNIRPRRAWHLAKASLRTLKRTLNNKKPPTTPMNSSS